MKKIGSFFCKRIKKQSGTTLVEMIVTLLLISIMLTMAAASLSSASKVFIRVQKTQYAQSILDTLMTELRGITQGATNYVKIYESGNNIIDNTGNLQGNALEFMNEEGYVELITTQTTGDRATSVTLYGADEVLTDTKQTLQPGRLYTRYYTRIKQSPEQRRYAYGQGTRADLIARAMAPAYGEGFYMNNYVKVTYQAPDGTAPETKIRYITATVALYSDVACTEANKIAEDTEILYFDNPVTYVDYQTAAYYDANYSN